MNDDWWRGNKLSGARYLVRVICSLEPGQVCREIHPRLGRVL